MSRDILGTWTWYRGAVFDRLKTGERLERSLSRERSLASRLDFSFSGGECLERRLSRLKGIKRVHNKYNENIRSQLCRNNSQQNFYIAQEILVKVTEWF